MLAAAAQGFLGGFDFRAEILELARFLSYLNRSFDSRFGSNPFSCVKKSFLPRRWPSRL